MAKRSAHATASFGRATSPARMTASASFAETSNAPTVRCRSERICNFIGGHPVALQESYHIMIEVVNSG